MSSGHIDTLGTIHECKWIAGSIIEGSSYCRRKKTALTKIYSGLNY